MNSALEIEFIYDVIKNDSEAKDSTLKINKRPEVLDSLEFKLLKNSASESSKSTSSFQNPSITSMQPTDV